MSDPQIIIPTAPLTRADLDKFKGNPFDDMIKFVVDIAQDRMAIGGDLHADAEQILLESGSQQNDVWGGNVWPWEAPPRVEYLSLINIRPAMDNPSMDILLPDIRARMDRCVSRWIPLP